MGSEHPFEQGTQSADPEDSAQGKFQKCPNL